MQINRTGRFLIAFFFLGGLAFTILEFTVFPSPILIGPIWMITAAGLGIYAWRSDKRAEHEQILFKTGTRAKGTLVKASSFGTVNEQPMMTLELELDVPGEATRRVSKRLVISDFAAHLMEPGLVLPVYLNPTDPEDVLVVW